MKTKHLTSFLVAFACCSVLCLGNVAAQESPFPAGPDQATGMNPNPRQQNAQNIMINARFAGWEEASSETEGRRVTNDLRGNWIIVDSNGRFEGLVVPGKGADVARMNVFLMNMGRLVKQTTLNEKGQFEFTNVRPGAYSLIGWGDKGFFAFGMNILAGNQKVAAVSTNRVKITAYQNATSINTDWIKYFASRVNFRVYGRYPSAEGPGDPAALYGFQGLSTHAPESVPATSISSHPVKRTADGRLVGRVHQLNSISGRPVDVRTTKVMLFEDDSVVASTTTDNYGVFEFRDVPDGSYAVTAAGVDGVGLIGITVGGTEAKMNDKGELVGEKDYPIDFTMISSETIGWLKHYADEVAYRRVILNTPPQPEPVAPAPYFGQGACPGCGNAAGGCDTCQQAYLLSICRSRGLTFEQWQTYCQGVRLPGSISLRNIGDGAMLADIAKAIQESSKKWDNVFDRAFYPNSGGGNLQYNQPYGQGYNVPYNQMYNQPYNQMYNQQYIQPYQQEFIQPNQQINGVPMTPAPVVPQQ